MAEGLETFLSLVYIVQDVVHAGRPRQLMELHLGGSFILIYR